MSKAKYPAVTKNFTKPRIPSNYTQPHEKEIDMSHTAEKLSRTDILAQALANAPSRARKTSSHVNILTEEQWRMIHVARTNNKDKGLQQLFTSMKQSYLENDEAFFKDYPQFYNTYRQAAKIYGLPLIKRSKV